MIVANGSFTPTPEIRRELETSDMVIAADGGAVHLNRLSRLPDLVIGDLDSIDDLTRDTCKSVNIPLHSHPPEKDMTDTELCIDHAVEQGASEIVLLGVTGRRLDHTLANILMLRPLLARGVRGRILDANNEIFLAASDITVTGTPGDLLSVIPVSETVTGLTLRGLAYPLTNKTLTMGTALGVSNVFVRDTATIKLRTGLVLVTKSWD